MRGGHLVQYEANPRHCAAGYRNWDGLTVGYFYSRSKSCLTRSVVKHYEFSCRECKPFTRPNLLLC